MSKPDRQRDEVPTALPMLKSTFFANMGPDARAELSKLVDEAQIRGTLVESGYASLRRVGRLL